jgi:hypothetical protein
LWLDLQGKEIKRGVGVEKATAHDAIEEGLSSGNKKNFARARVEAAQNLNRGNGSQQSSLASSGNQAYLQKIIVPVRRSVGCPQYGR